MQEIDARNLTDGVLEEKRQLAVKLCKMNMTRAEIGEMLGVHANTVGRWLKSNREQGQKALKPTKRGRRKGEGRRLNDEQERTICKLLIDNTPDQLNLPYTLWNRDSVGELIKNTLDIELPIRTVGHYLKRWGMAPQKPLKRTSEQQPPGTPQHSDDLITEIRNRKQLMEGTPYIETPRTSIIIQSFNHANNIPKLVDRYRSVSPDELIVVEDGSIDGSQNVWRELLNRRNDFLICANDIHEIRSYNRAVSFARGEIVLLCQDDDLPPKNPRWLGSVVSLFDAFPKLAIVGMRSAKQGLTVLPENYWFKERVPAIKSRYFFKDLVPDDRSRFPIRRFAFVPMVNIGPFAIRKSAYEDLGGFDKSFSPPGYPGIHMDYDLCLRAWKKDWQVGWCGVRGITRGVGGSGTLEFGFEKRRFNQAKRNAQRVIEKHSQHIDEIRAEANRVTQLLIKK